MKSLEWQNKTVARIWRREMKKILPGELTPDGWTERIIEKIQKSMKLHRKLGRDAKDRQLIH
jgi:hypothetical protein